MAEKINLNKHKKDIKKLNEEITNKFGNVNDTENIMVLSSEALALAVTVQKKFGSNKEQMAEIANFIKDLEFNDNGMLEYVSDDLIVEDGEVVSDCENCGQRDECENCYDTPLTSDETDWVDIFGAKLDINVLNKAIRDFEAEFENQSPYLVMSDITLRVFEEMSEGITCMDIGNNLCSQITDCDDCPASDSDEDMVYIEHDCEKGTINAYYLHNDEEYTIVIDNNIAFGVVKVR